MGDGAVWGSRRLLPCVDEFGPVGQPSFHHPMRMATRPDGIRPGAWYSVGGNGRRRRGSMASTLYMVVEHFKNQDAVAVYRRFREQGRLAPDGLVYVSSWV